MWIIVFQIFLAFEINIHEEVPIIAPNAYPASNLYEMAARSSVLY